jgi:hypothetical protein
MPAAADFPREARWAGTEKRHGVRRGGEEKGLREERGEEMKEGSIKRGRLSSSPEFTWLSSSRSRFVAESPPLRVGAVSAPHRRCPYGHWHAHEICLATRHR